MRAITMLFSVAALAVTASTTSAGIGCSCDGCGRKLVTVPTCEVVMQTVRETCYRDEERVKTVRVPKTVTVEKQVPYEYTVWVRVSKVDEQTIELKKPMFRWVDQAYTINVPAKDTVTRTRKRTKMVTAMVPETVYEEQTRVCTVRVPYERERLVPKAVVSSKSCWVPCECVGDSDHP